jgi:Putative transposase
MTLHPHEFIRRFLMHVRPKGFHRRTHPVILNPLKTRAETGVSLCGPRLLVISAVYA